MRLSDKHNTAPIPFRDSKLTRLLKSSLEGRSRVIIICNISPNDSMYEESLSTLKFAERAKKIKCVVLKNRISDNTMLLKQYEAEIGKLQNKLREMEMRLEGDSQVTLKIEIGELEERISFIEHEKGVLDDTLESTLQGKAQLEEELGRLKSFILSSENVRLSRALPEETKLHHKYDSNLRKSRVIALRKNSSSDAPKKQSPHIESDGLLTDTIDLLPFILNSENPLDSITGTFPEEASSPLPDEDYCGMSRDELIHLIKSQRTAISSMNSELLEKDAQNAVLHDELKHYKRNTESFNRQLIELREH